MAHSLYLSPVSHGETGPLTSVTSAQETSGVRWNGALRFEAVCFFVVFFLIFIVALGDQTGRIQLPPVDLCQLQRLFPSGVCLCDLERD